MCTISADLSNLRGALERKIGAHGSVYWSLNCDVCIRFGGTELEAYLEWKERVSTLSMHQPLDLVDIRIYTREPHAPDPSSSSPKIQSKSLDETMATSLFCRVVV